VTDSWVEPPWPWPRRSKEATATTVAPPGAIIDPPVWVVVDQLTALLGLKSEAQATQAALACATANTAVAHRVARVYDDASSTWRWPADVDQSAPLQTAALVLAVDAFRRPLAPAGVFRVDDFYARLPADIYVAVDGLIAASGADLDGGFA
jgi:hypothetical protein